ncbi:MAG TPA: VCBS repeat-containing protein, partial [Verrucomicrobiae bacterium]|nr:VCBS repeat-containing protein [Verrucomicrobiae bacterium]
MFAWLLAVVACEGATLKWEQHKGYRAAALNVPENGRTGFTLLTPEQTGIRFTNHLGYDRSEQNQNLLNGAGVAAGDVDGDGLCDLYFCNLEGPNGLYRNKGDWKFEDVAASRAAQCTNQTPRGTVMADVSGDGHLDILITSLSGPNGLLLNDGKGRFSDVTAAAGLVHNKAGGHTLALADIDGDGDLDVYVANYGENSILRSGGDISVRTVGGKPVVSGRHAARLKILNARFVELGQADVLYLNDGKGVFAAVPWNGGAFLKEDGTPLKAAPMDMGLSAMFRDVNGDNAPDLYVCNDFQSPDRFWINEGKGIFRLIDPLAIRTMCHFSMGVDFADIDRDGRDDFIVCDMLSRIHTLRMRQSVATNPPPEEVGETLDRPQVRRNTLYWNR